MKSLAALAAATLSAAAFAQPAVFTDIGNVFGPTVITHSAVFADPTEIRWFKFTTAADVTNTGTNYLDIDTEGTVLTGTGTNPTDTEIGLYRDTGALVSSDDDDGSNALSLLTYGATAAPRSAIGNSTVPNGRDTTATVSLPAGTYYLAYGIYNMNFAAGFGVTTTASAITTGSTGEIFVNFRTNLAPAVAPTDLGIASATASPVTVAATGYTTLLTVNIVPAQTPTPSTAIAVVGNLTAIGGSGTQSFYDDGSNGDVTAGDNIFSYSTPVTAAVGPVSLPVSAADAELRTANGSISLTVSAPTNPTATAAATPAGGLSGTAVLITATITSGNYPVSTNLVATADLSSIGGSATQVLFNDGSNGDLLAGNNVHSFATVRPTATVLTAYIVPVSIVDDQGRTASASATVTVLAPPVSEAVTLIANTTVTDTTTITTGQTVWYSFTVEDISAFTNRALEIDTEGSTILAATGLGDTGLCLYRSTGVIVTTDTLDGTDTLAALSYGVDNRLASGNGVAFNGRDGRLIPGTYYLAATAGPGTGGAVTYAANWLVTNTSTLSGDLVVNFRLFDPSIITAPTPPAATDLGFIAGTDADPATEDVIIINVESALGTIGWFRFSTNDAANDDADAAVVARYLDIDTEGTGIDTSGVGTLSDTEIGLYTPIGLLIASDDDDGSYFHSMLSFGDKAPARPYAGNPGGTSAARVGIDGDLPAGEYYLAIGNFNVTFNATDFNATSANTAAEGGAWIVNFRTNLPPAGCSTADIGIQGGVPGSDNLLDNNDFIVYIGTFFAMAPSADIGIQGGVPGHDNAWDNNDFIVYIGIFFTDTPNCTGNP